MQFANAEDALNFAIKREIEAARFYTLMAGRMQKREMREALLEMAAEEKSHRDRLIAVRDQGGFEAVSPAGFADLRISEYVEMPEITNDLDWAQALIVAMKREAAAKQLYEEMAARAPSEALRALFQRLAEEEGLHKRRFEAEYDERVLEGN